MTQSGGGGGGVHHHLNHHGLCCLSAAALPAPDAPPTPEPEAGGAAVAVAGVLHKWTNYGRGWRERWFSLHDGVLSYSKIRRDASAAADEDGGGGGGEVRLIGGASARIGGARRPDKPVGVVCLKVTQSSPAISQIMFFFFCPNISRFANLCLRGIFSFFLFPNLNRSSINHILHCVSV